MADYSLIDTFETSGQWFLPEAPDRNISGVLRYSPKGTELQLDGSFWEPQHIFAHSHHTYPVVHGITRDGEAVSLFVAHQAGVHMGGGIGGMHVSERLVTSRLFIGAHIQPDFKFTKVRFRIPGLQYWQSRPAVERIWEKDEATGKLLLQVRLLRLDNLISQIPSIDASIEWDIQGDESDSIDQFSGIQIKVTGWITIRPNSPQALEWYLQQMAKLETLLAFMAGDSMSPDRMDGYEESEQNHISILLTFGNRSYCGFTRYMDFFMPLSSTGIPLESLLRRWFDIYPLIEKPTELARSIFSSGRERLWLHLEFLAWMQAMEGLQRSIQGHILKPIQPLRKKHPSLRERLDSLTSLLPVEFCHFILEEGAVPRCWIDTRDYYTHWIEKMRDGVLDNPALYDANVRAKNLMVGLYLTMAGIPVDSILRAYQGANGMAQELLTRNSASAHKKDPNSGMGLIMAVLPAPRKSTVESESSQ
jgi:hypothetical protein